MTTGAAASERISARRLGWADALLLFTILIWGVNPSVVKAALREISPLALNAIRFTLAGIMEMVILYRQGQDLRMPWKDLRKMIPLAFVGVILYQIAYIFGLNRTTAGNSSVLLATMPIFVALYSGLIKGRRLGRRVWAGICLTLSGVAVITLGSGRAFSLTQDTIAGNLLILFGAMCWAAYTVGSVSLMERYSPAKLTTFSMILTGPVLVLIAIPDLLATDWPNISLAAWGGTLFSGAFSIAIAYLLWNMGVKRLGGTRAAVYSNLTPLVALASGWLILGERLTILQMAGVLIVLFGVWLTRFAHQKQTG